METLIMMVLFLGFVWGGFIFCISLAIKKNKAKRGMLEE
ncbi:MAG: MetS family NSS transporter small subunit [Candidatus Marinimicrobia bacterium]|nr:MetS family NSS transporter small subunit [Candidatus Neomarinimicrobiota bacterium]